MKDISGERANKPAITLEILCLEQPSPAGLQALVAAYGGGLEW